jgi:NAD(P)H-flavin reductase/Ca2+-binding EF-hand superfamily protein
VETHPSDDDLIDRVNSGGEQIDRRELQKRLGLESEHLAERIFAQLDMDRDGLVSTRELARRMKALSRATPEMRLRFVFAVHDADANGFIDHGELLSMLRISLAENRLVFGERMIEDLCDAMFERADVNGDRRISFDEFSRALAAYPGVVEQMTIGDLRWLGLGPTVPVPVTKPIRTTRSDALYLALVVLFVLANAALFALAMYRYRDASLAIQLARGCGACLNLAGSLILVPMMRRTFTMLGRGKIGRFLIDDHVRFHRLVGNTALALALGHAAAHVMNVALLRWPLATITGWAFLTGALLLLVHGVMWFFAREKVRRVGGFRSFAWTHRLWPLWIGLLLLHGPAAWIWLAVPTFVYALDRIFGQRVQRTLLVGADVLASGVTRLTIARPDRFSFRPGDYVFVRIPKLAGSEWHPFTISSAPERTDAITLHVRSVGHWTTALHTLAKETEIAKSPLRLDVIGPYATPTARVLESKVAVMIAAGIGVTPFASVLASLLVRPKDTWPLERVHFVWVCKEQRAFEWFAELLGVLERAAPDRFTAHIFMDAGRSDLRSTVLRVAIDALYAKSRTDLVTGLSACTTLGAPDWDTLIGSISRHHDEVDAFYCGPPGLAKIVKETCLAHEVSFQQEHF